MTGGWTVREVPTPQGPARLHRRGRAPAGSITLVLGHGAGGGVEAADLQAFALALAGPHVAVVMVEQPWRVSGRRIAPRPAALDEAWIAAVSALRPRGPLVIGGRSAGARVACRTAEALGAAAVLALAFPLHPPGRPARTRADEATRCRVPLLVVQGTRDAFGSAREVRTAVPNGVVAAVEGADHSLARGDLRPAIEQTRRLLSALRE